MKNNSLSKLAAIILIAAFMLCALAGCSKSPDSPPLEHNLIYFYSNKTGSTALFHDGERLEGRINGAIGKLGTVDGMRGFAVAGTGLYRIGEDGVASIYPAAVTKAVQSLDCEKILFTTATKAYLYDDARREYSELGGIDCEVKSFVSLVLSPDGGAAGFTVKNENDELKSYIVCGGETRSLGEKTCLVAVANEGKRLYWLGANGDKPNDELYFVENDRAKLIAEGVSTEFEVTRDLGEITFDMGGATCISRNGGTAQRIVDGFVFSHAGGQFSEQGGGSVKTHFKNTNTLLDSVFYADIVGQDENGDRFEQYDVYYVDSSLRSSKLFGGADQFSVSGDGKTVLAIVDDALYRVSAYNPGSPEKLASSAYTFCCDDEQNVIYVVNMLGELRRYDHGEPSVVLVTGVELVKQTAQGVLLVYSPQQDGGTLFSLKNDRAEPVAMGVSGFEVYRNCAVYLVKNAEMEGSFDVYMSRDGVDFTLAEEMVSFGG